MSSKSPSRARTSPKGGPTPKRSEGGKAADTDTPSWTDRLPDGSRSVQSIWVWRGFFLMSLIAVGIGIGLDNPRQRVYAYLWWVIAAGWFSISMWLWRKHVRDDDAAYAASRKTGGRAR